MLSTSIGVAAERIQPELHLSQMQIGWMMWAYTVMYMVAQIPGSAFFQRYGARLTYVLIGVGGLVATIATPLVSMVLAGTALFVAMAFFQGLCGMSQGPLNPMSAGVCETWFPASQWARFQGLQTTAMTIGMVLTPPMVVMLTQRFGWRTAQVLNSRIEWLRCPPQRANIDFSRF